MYFVPAFARGPARFRSHGAFLGFGSTQPCFAISHQFFAIAPLVGVITSVCAKFAQTTRLRTSGTRLSPFVRSAQFFLPVSAEMIQFQKWKIWCKHLNDICLKSLIVLTKVLNLYFLSYFRDIYDFLLKLIKNQNHLRRTIIADIIEESLSSGSTIRTFGESASDFVSGRPNHLSIMPNHFEVIVRRSVREVHVLQIPSFHSEKPESAQINLTEIRLGVIGKRAYYCALHWHSLAIV